MDNVTIETMTVGDIQVPVINDKIREMLEKSAGPIQYPLTNDRSIRGAASYSPTFRRSYAAILLDMPEEEIVEAEMLNPISFGENPGNDKKTEEDIRLLVNREIFLDSEISNYFLDVNNKRYLLYLCRNVNELGRGQDYDALRPNVFVEVANYAQAKGRPEFLSKYRILNLATYEPFFENDLTFAINVLNLTQTDLANESDITSRRLLLAQLFLVNTWGNLRELAHRSPFAMEAACIMVAQNADRRERIALEAARRDAEVKLTLNNRREKAEKRAEEAESRADRAEKERDSEKQRADALEKRIQELEAQLKAK